MSQRSIVITGANSYLGRFAVNYLREKTPHRIVEIVSPRAPQPAPADARVEYFRADLASTLSRELKEKLLSADCVFHFAWTRSGSAEEVSRANRVMIEQLLGAMRDPSRLWFISSVSASPRPFSVYGRTKYEAANLVLERGGGVLVCGLVVEPEPPRGPYKMLKKNVGRFPLAFRATSGEPLVFPLRLEDLGATLVRVAENDLPAGIYRMFSQPVGFNAFIELIEQLRPRKRLRVPFPASLVLKGAALAKKTRIVPGKLCDQVLTFLYKDSDYLLSQSEIPGLTLRPCADRNFFSDRFQPASGGNVVALPDAEFGGTVPATKHAEQSFDSAK